MTDWAAGQDPYILAQIRAKVRPAVTKIRFLDYRSKYPSGLLVAVEGDDDKVVYSYWISRVVPQLSFEFFVCGGKRGVRQLKNSLFKDRGGADLDTLFLVDRDFDDLDGFCSVDSVFMLDRYSIENYLVDSRVLSTLIKAAFPGSGDPLSRNAISSLFDDDYQNFLTHARDVNKRLFLARKLSIDVDHLVPVSLSNLAKVSLGKVEHCVTRAEDVLPFDIESDDASIESLVREFDSLEPRSRYRGKYAYKFLRTWLNMLIDEYKRPCLGLFTLSESAQSKVKPDELSLGSLASRSDLPQGFERFFQAIAGRYEGLASGDLRTA